MEHSFPTNGTQQIGASEMRGVVCPERGVLTM